jgi:hypothetical protein
MKRRLNKRISPSFFACEFLLACSMSATALAQTPILFLWKSW